MAVSGNLQKRLGIAVFVAIALCIVGGSAYAQGRDMNAEIVALPANLERISWGGIIAGTIIAIVIQLAGNLLAIGIGVGRINPNPDFNEDPSSAESIGTNTIIMIAATVVISLFVGGYVAARFAGSPNQGDALLNGLMVWGLDTVITLFLLTTTLGTVFSGLSSLLGQGVRLISGATAVVAQGAGSVIQGTASAARSMGGAIGDAAGTVGDAVSTVAGNAADTARDAANDAIRTNPDLQRISNEQDTIVKRIQDEAMRLVNQAGVDPNALKGEAQNAVADAKQTVQETASRIQENPAQAQQLIGEALNKLFQRGQNVTSQVSAQVSQVDRDKAIDLLAERANISREDAVIQFEKWETDYNRVRQQGEQTLKQVRQQSEKTMQQVRQEAERLQAEASATLEQARIEAEKRAREAADAAAKLVSRVALAGFAAIVIGGFAAGIGGIAGAPGTISTIEVDDNDTNQLPQTPVLMSTITPGVMSTTTPGVMATTTPGVMGTATP